MAACGYAAGQPGPFGPHGGFENGSSAARETAEMPAVSTVASRGSREYGVFTLILGRGPALKRQRRVGLDIFQHDIRPHLGDAWQPEYEIVEKAIVRVSRRLLPCNDRPDPPHCECPRNRTACRNRTRQGIPDVGQAGFRTCLDARVCRSRALRDHGAQPALAGCQNLIRAPTLSVRPAPQSRSPVGISTSRARFTPAR